MRGKTIHQGAMFSYVSLEDRIPKSHPLRQLRLLVDVRHLARHEICDLYGLSPMLPQPTEAINSPN